MAKREPPLKIEASLETAVKALLKAPHFFRGRPLPRKKKFSQAHAEAMRATTAGRHSKARKTLRQEGQIIADQRRVIDAAKKQLKANNKSKKRYPSTRRRCRGEWCGECIWNDHSWLH